MWSENTEDMDNLIQVLISEMALNINKDHQRKLHLGQKKMPYM